MPASFATLWLRGLSTSRVLGLEAPGVVTAEVRGRAHRGLPAHRADDEVRSRQAEAQATCSRSHPLPRSPMPNPLAPQALPCSRLDPHLHPHHGPHPLLGSPLRGGPCSHPEALPPPPPPGPDRASLPSTASHPLHQRLLLSASSCKVADIAAGFLPLCRLRLPSALPVSCPVQTPRVSLSPRVLPAS